MAALIARGTWIPVPTVGKQNTPVALCKHLRDTGITRGYIWIGYPPIIKILVRFGWVWSDMAWCG
jgi:hypothetical protein